MSKKNKCDKIKEKFQAMERRGQGGFKIIGVCSTYQWEPHNRNRFNFDKKKGK